MKIDIFSDFVCPFCTLGERNLTLALQDFEGKDDVEITWRAFQLDPQAPKEGAPSVTEYLVDAKGMDAAKVEANHERLADNAAAVGLEFNWREAVMANTWDAHRIAQLAKQENKGSEWDAVVKDAYFTHGGNVADHAQLKRWAAIVGLDGTRVEEVLSSDEFSTEVAQEIAMAHQFGVKGVPFFIFNGQFAVSGAQPVDAFRQALEQVAEHERTNPAANLPDPNNPLGI